MDKKWSMRILSLFSVCLVIVSILIFHHQTAKANKAAEEVSIPAVALTPIPTAEGAGVLQVKITNTYTDQEYTPKHHVVGTITNNSTFVSSSIEMTMQAVNAKGESVLTDYLGNSIDKIEIYTEIAYIWPGETVPFDISFYVSSPPADISVVITHFYDSSNLGYIRANVRLENLSFKKGANGYVYITGELVNMESTWVDAGRVYGVTLDSNGTVLSGDLTVYHRWALAPSGDARGRDRTPFMVEVPDPGVQISDVNVYFDPMAEEAPSNWLDVDVTNTYYDSLGYYHVVGWLTNNGSEPWITDNIVAGLYGQSGKILDVGWGYMSGGYLAPGERVPFDAWVPDAATLVPKTTIIDHMTVESDGFRNRYLDILAYVTLTSSEVQVSKEQFSWTVSGSVTNTSSKLLRTGEVLIAVYDTSGNLVARADAGLLPSGKRWFPGETIDYSTKLYLDPSVDTSGYTFGTFVQGWYGLSDEQGGSYRPSGPFTPELTTYIPRPSDLSTEPKVVGGNLLLAALIMLPFAVAAELFTRMLGEKETTFKPMIWMRRFSSWIESKTGAKLHQPGLVDILKLLGVLFFYGLVFSLLEPGWKPFSSEGISLFLYLTLANGLVGLADDIIQWRKLRKWGDAADFAVRPTNFIIAAVSVAVSRIFSLIPGLLFGTPEALRTDNESLDLKKRKALLRSSAVTAVVLILAFWLPTLVTGMLLKGALSSTGTKVVSGIEAFLLVIFAVALENTFVKMLGFSEGFGQALRKKNRWLWFVGLVGVTFLFLHTLLNPRGSLAEAMEEGNVMLFLVASIGFMVIALIMWASTAKTRKAAAAQGGALPPNMPPPPPSSPNPVVPPSPLSPPPVPGSKKDQK